MGFLLLSLLRLYILKIKEAKLSCCIVTLTPFVNASLTVIAYSGNKPTVTVSYLIDGVWQALGVVTQIIFGAASVTVDHGGLNTGVIKFVQ